MLFGPKEKAKNRSRWQLLSLIHRRSILRFPGSVPSLRSEAPAALALAVVVEEAPAARVEQVAPEQAGRRADDAQAAPRRLYADVW